MRKFVLFFSALLTFLAFSLFFSTSQASAQCTTFVTGDGSPPCDTPQFDLGSDENHPCTVANLQPPYPNTNLTGSQCAANFNRDCQQTYTTFGWYAEWCVRPTPTPTPFRCAPDYGIYFSCYSNSTGCPENWVPASQNPDTSCGSSMTCCWYNPPPVPTPTDIPQPTLPPSCVQQPGSFAWSDCDRNSCNYAIDYWYNCDGTTYPDGGGTDYGCGWTCPSAPTPTTPPPGYTPPPATPTPPPSGCANPPPGLVETGDGWGYTCSASYCSGSGSPADACGSTIYQCLAGTWQRKWPQCGVDLGAGVEFPCRGCSASMPTPIPTVAGSVQPCGSCPEDCGAGKSRCYSDTGADMGCQDSFSCFINSNNVCTWDPTNCTRPSDGGGTLRCTECKYGNTGLSDQPATFIENYEDPATFGCNASEGYFQGQSYGPGKDEIQGHIDNCEWRRSTGEGCGGEWGTADYDIKYCICGDGTAQWNGGGLTVNPNSIYLGDTTTVEMTSYKAYDLDTGGANSQDPHPVYLGATTPSGTKQYFGPPSSITNRPIDRVIAGWNRSYTLRVFRWNLGPSQINQQGIYNLSFYVGQESWSCAQTTLTVLGPTPTPLPGFMQIIGGDVYSNE